MPVVGNHVRVVRPEDPDWAPHTLWRARVDQTGVVVAEHGRWIHVKHEDGSVIAWRKDELAVLWSR